MKVLAIKLVDYREWTERLGYDREWLIQKIQNKFMMKIHEIASQYSTFPLQLRFDNFLMIVDGITNTQLIYMINDMQENLPVGIKTCLGYGKTPLEAQWNASVCLNNKEDKFKEYVDEKIAALHFDINFNTEALKYTSVYDSFLEITNIYVDLSRFLYKIGGILQYLGGDNYLGFVSTNSVNKVIEKFSDDNKIKVGIGIGQNARTAIKLATTSLEKIRNNREKTWHIEEEYH
ncbi:GTP cyclohydrolase IIa [Sulfolobus islandicus L.S.2.15]|uniref:GTP cyclohydrolase III n=8 Tax=Saccharolobus islandicus TaxID=43080 RepID=GCH3_SACI1|nr:GTP cyclohydrolase IIa [Sulfolobus islandicus]C3MR15.1 RecName: Full=GTP cyclohydrolase III [Sulfolobus islandicus L.S.2.15]C3NGF2.1 RecName: Full=GTP cyclohydrolase III [Sulfolobus islandicus Y.N.15.51]ACP35828.1 GTP cyclohydrolase IIa [Sulfolobus islandicus L.S.2.15]ACP48212.1 GTP cyclohydrolase IIa [Sulfolobus islandicus Y.N.15.51]ADB87617.1 GTP cyclohydrolase IIa [Sulfolobus islandicus L.D.8.5]PVU78748.1 GTP cyclohydrolase [Sulfolobus islandicus]